MCRVKKEGEQMGGREECFISKEGKLMNGMDENGGRLGLVCCGVDGREANKI